MTKKVQIPVDLAANSMLIIDDNENARRIIEAILRSWVVKEIRKAGNGAEGLEILKNWVPDLIISDWNMRPMDGGAFLKRLRHVDNGDLGKTPVLVVTAHSSGPVVKSALRAGANQIIVKPIVPAILYARIVWTLQDERPFTQSGDHFVLTPPHSAASSAEQNEPENEAWMVD